MQFIVFLYPIVMASLPESWILYKNEKQESNDIPEDSSIVELLGRCQVQRHKKALVSYKPSPFFSFQLQCVLWIFETLFIF